MSTTKQDARKMKSVRLSLETLRLLAGLAERLTLKDGVRKITETEAMERAIHALAKKEGVR